MPNAIAYGMLLIWPLVCLLILRRMPLERGLIWCILGGYLLLPQSAEFDLPLVPSMDKVSIPNISAFVICVFVLGKKISIWPQSRVAKVLTALFVFGAIPTVLTNSDPILFGVIVNSAPIEFATGRIPGLGLRDLLSVFINQVIVVLPFLMARQYLSSDTGLRELLLAMVVGALVYSIPSLVEIRISPQINIWVYGFFQHNFIQMIRDGGFRPIVFLPHALWLAFFFLSAALAAAALSRTVAPLQRPRYLVAVVCLLVMLSLCKSLATMMYGIALTPIVLLTSSKFQIRLAVAFATVAVIYPILRNGGLVPIDAILEQANAYSAERGQSLGYRFNNEELLLNRADEKTWFGWGGWGRNLLRNAHTGLIETIPDGRWIIVFGTFGWVGYVAEMGLLASPLVMLGLQARKIQSAALSPYVAPIAVILAITMIDMLLNATLTPLTWMCAGAILGHAERLQDGWIADPKKTLFGDGPVLGRPAQRDVQRPTV
ncbi:MAG: hypothetical protein ACI92Z_003794 [Paracoccaceae bacterium]|jgi:hypothetical protein